jgi:hypothetical protein
MFLFALECSSVAPALLEEVHITLGRIYGRRGSYGVAKSNALSVVLAGTA